MSRWLSTTTWLRRPFNLIRLCALLLVGGLLVLGSNYIRKVRGYSGSILTEEYASYRFHTLKNPTGIAYTPGLSYTIYGDHAGLIIADTGNNMIRGFDMVSKGLETLAGNGTAGYVNGTPSSAEFDHPTGLEVFHTHLGGAGQPNDWNDIFVGDSHNYVIRIFCTGNVDRSVDKKCPYNNGLRVGTYAGNHTKGFVDGTLLTAQFAHVSGVHTGVGYSVDPDNHAIRGISGTNVTTYAGTGSPGFVNGYRTSAQFNTPTKMTAGATGSGLYIADAGNHVIRRIDTSGNVTTFSGSGTSGYADGPPYSAKFVWPTSVVFNAADNYFYVADPINNTIRRIDQAGNVSTYTGSPTATAGYADGTLSQARYSNPTDLVIQGGYMYISDTNNNCIRRIDMSAGVVSTYIN